MVWGEAHLELIATWRLDKDQAAFWDDAAKGVAGLVAVVGAIATATKYLDERSKENHASLIEAQRPFFEKRQQVYTNLVKLVAFLGNSPRESPQWQVAKTEAWRLYWGELPLVSSDNMSPAARFYFQVALLRFENLRPEQVVEAEYDRLRWMGMQLVLACRASLGEIEPRKSQAARLEQASFSRGVTDDTIKKARETWGDDAGRQLEALRDRQG